MKRKEGMDFEEYKKIRKIENDTTRKKLNGTLIHNSRELGPYVIKKDKIVQ